MSTTEAPSPPAAHLQSDAVKAKRQAGLDKYHAEQRAKKAAAAAQALAALPAPPAAPAPSPSAPDLLAEIERLKAALAAKSVPADAASAAVTKAATIRFEAWYEYKPPGGWKVVEAKGLSRIFSDEDPRWDGELMAQPYNGSVGGCLRVAEVTRLDGRAIETRDIQGGPCHMNTAREFMRLFRARAEAGERRPWDTEHFHRDQLAEAERAKREGRLEDLALIAEMFKKAMQGGPGSLAEAAK